MVIHHPADPQSRALARAGEQDDVLLTREATQLGLSAWGIAGLRRASGVSVARGAVAIEPVRDPVRTSARAVQLLLPAAVISHVTAARLHGLEGLGYWEPNEGVHAVVPRTATRWQRAGVHLHFVDVEPEDVVLARGLRVTSVPRTLFDCACVLDRAGFVSVADSAVRHDLLSLEGLQTVGCHLQRMGMRTRGRWITLVDGRSESPSESTVRLVLIDAALAPDVLQHDVWTPSGFHVARLDMAWVRNGKKVGLEVDSAEHDRPRALYRDRERLNSLRSLGWDVRQVTAHDARRRPGYVVQQVRQALSAQ